MPKHGQTTPRSHISLATTELIIKCISIKKLVFNATYETIWILDFYINALISHGTHNSVFHGLLSFLKALGTGTIGTFKRISLEFIS